MSAKIEYKTVYEVYPKDFDSKVNALLNDGWTLYGDPYSATPACCQALTRPKPDKPDRVGAVQGPFSVSG